MSTLEEVEAEQWLIENGHMHDPYKWTEWRRIWGWRPRRSSMSNKLIFGRVYTRRKKVRYIDRSYWEDRWVFQYATKKEVFLAKLGDK